MVADRFDYPVGPPDGGGFYVQQSFEAIGQVYDDRYHSGVDLQNNSGGAATVGNPVFAVANGEVVYANSEAKYPGGVVIIRHVLQDNSEWFSQYGHLGSVSVSSGSIARGQQVGTILSWPDNVANSHLHFEIRNFLTKDPMNGDNASNPRHRPYPPGPGYWPSNPPEYDGERPTDRGWVDPLNFINTHRSGTPVPPQSTSTPGSPPTSTPPPAGSWHVEYVGDRELRNRCYETYESSTYLSKNWGDGSPAQGCPNDDFSARFTKSFSFPGGEYWLHAQHDDGVRVFIDGQVKIDAWWDSSFEGHDWRGNLSNGNHEVKVEYYERTGGARLEVMWYGPGYLDTPTPVWTSTPTWTPTPSATPTPADTTPPVTSANLAGTPGADDWYISPVLVSLPATDDRSGAANTYYSLNGAAEATYYAPFSVASQGSHRLSFYSIDQAGNREQPPKSITFKIDSVAPNTSATLKGTTGDNGWHKSAVVVSLSSSDATSGIRTTYYAIDGGAENEYATPFSVGSEGSHSVAFRSVDMAGNSEGTKVVTFKIDSAPPSGGLSINGGAATTIAAQVALAPQASDATSGLWRMRLRNNQDQWSDWEPYASTRTWIIPVVNGVPVAVSAQYQDRAGNTSTAYSASITPDIYPPKPSSPGFRITADTIGAGDGGSQSPQHRLLTLVAQPGSSGRLQSDFFRLEGGFLASQESLPETTITPTRRVTLAAYSTSAGSGSYDSPGFQLDGTFGQPAAGFMFGPLHRLGSGFWQVVYTTSPLRNRIWLPSVQRGRTP